MESPPKEVLARVMQAIATWPGSPSNTDATCHVKASEYAEERKRIVLHMQAEGMDKLEHSKTGSCAGLLGRHALAPNPLRPQRRARENEPARKEEIEEEKKARPCASVLCATVATGSTWKEGRVWAG